MKKLYNGRPVNTYNFSMWRVDIWNTLYEACNMDWGYKRIFAQNNINPSLKYLNKMI